MNSAQSGIEIVHESIKESGNNLETALKELAEEGRLGRIISWLGTHFSRANKEKKSQVKEILDQHFSKKELFQAVHEEGNASGNLYDITNKLRSLGWSDPCILAHMLTEYSEHQLKKGLAGKPGWDVMRFNALIQKAREIEV